MAGEKDRLPTSEKLPERERPTMSLTNPSRRWHYPLILLCAGLFIFLNNVHASETLHSIEDRVDKILSETPLIGRLWDYTFYVPS